MNYNENIRAVGFLAALMVVAIHCPSATYEWVSGAVTAPTWMVVLQFVGTDTVARLAVPWFFVISGFFMMKSAPTQIKGFSFWWVDAVGRRVVSLGIPYLIWNAIYYFLKLSKHKYAFSVGHCFEQLTGANFLDVPSCGQFWYVRCLLVFVLCAPVFVLLMRGFWNGMLLLLLLTGVWILGIDCSLSHIQPLNIEYILYFSTGVYIGMHKSTLADGKLLAFLRYRGVRICLVLLFIVLAGTFVWASIAGYPYISRGCTKMFIVIGLILLWVFGDVIRRFLNPLCSFWGLAFFIYAFHPILVSLICKVLEPMPYNCYHSIGYVIKVGFAATGSLFVGVLLRRVSPVTMRLLCGGRT